MKKFTVSSIAIALLFVSAALAQSPESAKDQDKPAKEAAAPSKEQAEPARDQAWLKQLVGEWEVQLKSYMMPDQPPVESTGIDSVRTLGDHWILAEIKFAMTGAPLSGILSLGYDPQKEEFKGTWIDSMSGYLWVYKGTLNDAGDTMTLRTEGPSMRKPGETARYKEVITIKDKDHRTFSSSIETADGKWMTILEAEYTRKE